MLGTTRKFKGFLSSLAVCVGLSFSVQAVADVYVADGHRGNNGSLYTVDVDTGALTTVAPLAEAIHSLAFGADDQTLYGLTLTWRNGPGGNGKVVLIDLTTGAFTDITATTPERFDYITYHFDGFLYAITQSSNLYRINPSTGDMTLLWNIGFRRGLASDGFTVFGTTGTTLREISLTEDSQPTIGGHTGGYDRAIKDMTFDPASNRLLGIDRSGGILSVDRTNGNTTLLSDTGGNRIAIAAPGAKDDDADGMNDFWEIFYGLNPAFDDSAQDLDGDGVSNLQEFLLFGNPTKVDTDDDGLTDPEEITLGTSLADSDTDSDGKSDYFESILGSDPLADERILAIGTTAGTGTSDNAAVATDDDGNVHVVYDNDDLGDYEVYYTMLGADGSILIGSTLISDDDGDNSKMPDVAVANGKVYVVWHSNNYSDPEIELAVLDPSLVSHDGSSANPAILRTVGPVNVSGDDNRKSNHARIAVGTDNKLHVVLEERDEDEMRYLKLETNGSVINDVTLTDAENDMFHAMPDIVIDNQNKVHLTWRSASSEMIWYALINGNNGQVLIDSTLISSSGGYHSSTVNIDSDGVVTLVYGEDNDSIRMIRLNPVLDDMDGSAATLADITTEVESIIVDEDASANNNRPRHPFARMNEDGSLLVSYLTEGSSGTGSVRFINISADGSTSAGQTLLSNSARNFEQMKISRGGEILVVATGSSINLFKDLQLVSASVNLGSLQIVGYSEDDLPAGAETGAPTPHEDSFFTALITVPVGGTTTLTLPTTTRLPLDSTFEVWTPADGWVELDVPNLADATVTLTDGGPGDADGVADGYIVIKASALVAGGRSFISDFLDAGGSLFDDDDDDGIGSGGSIGGIMLMLLLANGLFSVVRRRKSLH